MLYGHICDPGKVLLVAWNRSAGSTGGWWYTVKFDNPKIEQAAFHERVVSAASS